MFSDVLRCPEFSNLFDEVFMKHLLIFTRFALIVLLFIPSGSFADKDGAIQLNKGPRGPITLKEAVALALLNNPQLQVFSFGQRAREARALQ